ncbi:NAD(P)/FAD-dependent oxidoreductase [Streptomyces sp. 150FB]|uniref:FAD-dependent oxidoreductase n=1 Tax=Streptomyces sp. 150FB TaxID=1576605 RepID=UPI000696236B|nr:NAD(P)/FAD-dependent oxidoreductase [Streptomyces sp. 150FB]
MRVLIVGAGLGGLCLAQGLLHAGVEVTVLERRGAAGEQPATYGIHLNTDGMRALHACLPEKAWQRLIDVSALAPDKIRFHDQDLGVLAVRDNEANGGVEPHLRRRAVGRDALRDVLLTGLPADTVRWNKQVSDYTETPEGIRVRCADGSEYGGDLLVGADGSNSRIRALRLPGLERQELGIVNVSGRVTLTEPLLAELPAALTDGSVNNVVPSGPGWMFLSTWDAPASGRYLVWAWAADRDDYPGDPVGLSPAALRDHVAGRTAHWAPALHRLVAATEPGTVAAIPLRTMPALEPWEPGNVTLLGDAVHNMTPMAGIGANTALRDADELRGALLAEGEGEGTGTGTPTEATLTARVGTYEAAMRDYANAALALSTRNARAAATTGRLSRGAFRTVLRVAEAVPAVKRRMFPAPGGRH